jgi:hypothetical protein
MFRGRLWSEDIPAFVLFEYHIGNNWPLGLGLGGARVQVPNGLEDEARAVWLACEAGVYRDELESEFGPFERIICPHCGSPKWRWYKPWLATFMDAIIVFGLGLPLPSQRERRVCRVCKTRWNAD